MNFRDWCERYEFPADHKHLYAWEAAIAAAQDAERLRCHSWGQKAVGLSDAGHRQDARDALKNIISGAEFRTCGPDRPDREPQ